MLARIRKSQDEGGFTLIELLVVIIIIGILAAIAIPTFLRQREKGWMAAVKSDIKNATTAMESYGTSHDGEYTADIADVTGDDKEGYNPTDGVTVVVEDLGDASTSFTLCGSHEKLPDGPFFHYDSLTGQLVQDETACPEAAA